MYFNFLVPTICFDKLVKTDFFGANNESGSLYPWHLSTSSWMFWYVCENCGTPNKWNDAEILELLENSDFSVSIESEQEDEQGINVMNCFVVGNNVISNMEWTVF